ncbi:transposon Tf2-8 polyprotein [Trichonephila inaurata madagascariensis]|uniref:Transposon Tf2-8 polyprotein n=1 Tax=Trichonephila inaurata madagascariensis TaxID=2747483 RepID=A0A8X6X8C5_9ARAC|nr:transposon Tf2-8 polyprotein [Trichonephila inaurata madagascariensis]
MMEMDAVKNAHSLGHFAAANTEDWLHLIKNTTAQKAIKRLTLQHKTFGNSKRIITDTGGAFRFKEFEKQYVKVKIRHVIITTGVQKGNGQIERIHRVLIPMLMNVSLNNMKRLQHVDSLQRMLNSIPSRSTKYLPFELLLGIKMKIPEDNHKKFVRGRESRSTLST